MKIIRGDTKKLRFKRVRKPDETVITEVPDKMYFTVKYSYDDEEAIFQKTLENGIRYNEDDNYYYMTIKPQDTDGLPYAQLVYDIEIIVGSKKTTIAIGTIDVLREVTFPNNEV